MNKFKRWDKTTFIQNLLLFLIYIIALYPLTKVGFAAEDDIDLYCNCFTGRWANLSDVSQGRFYLTFMRYIFAVPYLFESKLWLDFCRITPIAISFLLFVLLVKRVFHSEAISLFCAVFIACFLQIMGSHSITTAYPFYFTTGFVLLLFSLHLFLFYYEKEKKKKYLFFSCSVMFLCSLFYESFVMYYVIFAAIAAWKNNLCILRTKENLTKTLKDLVPFIVGACIYVIAYLVFRHFHTPIYNGLLFPKKFTLLGWFKSATNMTLGAFPLQTYLQNHHLLNVESLANDGTFSLFHTDLVFYIEALMAVFLLCFASRKYQNKIQYSWLIAMFVCGILFVYLPVIPVSIGEKYYTMQIYNYVPTFFSFFGFVLMFCAVYFSFVNLLGFNKWILNIFNTLFFSLFFISAICVQMINKASTNDLRLSQIRIDIASDLLKYKIIPNFDTTTAVCLEQIHHTSSIQGENMTWQATFWWQFFQKKTGKHYNLFDKYSDFYLANKDNNNNNTVWTAFFKQSTKNEDALLYLAPKTGSLLPQKQEDMICDTLIGLYHSPYKTFNVTIITQSVQDSVFINGMLMQSVGNWHNLDISFPAQKKQDYSLFTIYGKRLIASSLTVSNILQNNLTQESKEINQIIETILSSPGWLEIVKKQAKDENISLGQALENNARWVLDQKRQEVQKSKKQNAK